MKIEEKPQDVKDKVKRFSEVHVPRKREGSEGSSYSMEVLVPSEVKVSEGGGSEVGSEGADLLGLCFIWLLGCNQCRHHLDAFFYDSMRVITALARGLDD